ncbi:MAG TPA: DUF4301 family protein [Bacteroidales bacterium]|nr:DUF4301 family protein [Bacteroidales bacterium]
MFSQKDLVQIQQHGLTLEQINSQIASFKTGFPFLKVLRPATPNNGIKQIDEPELSSLIAYYSENKKGKKLLKFVPASGAATRMFKSLLEYVGNIDESKVPNDVNVFISEIRNFAFYNNLKNKAQSLGLDIEQLINEGKYKTLINLLLEKEGLNYGNLPKGLLKFHSYTDSSRTPVEEHMAEGVSYALSDAKEVHLHFTVSPEHMQDFNQLVNGVINKYEDKYGCKFYISYSVQKTSTDTIAVDINNSPFREHDESLVFRPGGHGALLENLNDLDADVIFIKNIDNVAPDRLKETTFIYKKVLAGILLQKQDQVFEYIKQLSNGKDVNLAEVKSFIESNLGYVFPQSINGLGSAAQKEAMVKILKRPIRVCGMVKNQGEPGGGPFWVEANDGSASLQILESSQFNFNDERQKDIFKQSTHFNPVDLVIATKDYKGKKMNLLQFSDPDTAFISFKSKDGKELKALELPGLWNGAMANWNTIFVEVPLATFSPVKTVNDLIREEHRA